MKRLALVISLMIPIYGFCQTASNRILALNNYAAYANQSAEEVKVVFTSILSYYPGVKNYQKKQSYQPGYECRVTLDEYFFNKAISESKILSDASSLNLKINALHEAASVIDSKCKALDTYHKLEDYKQDNFLQAEVIINELQKAIVNYRVKQADLSSALEMSWRKLVSSASTPYSSIDKMMKDELLHERLFLDLWNYNLMDDIHTGWPVKELQESIQQNDGALASFKNSKSTVEYPANTMVGSFKESIGEMLSIKRIGLDGNNYEAKKSDKHSNEVYLDLVNSYNGRLINDHNTYLNFATAQGFMGLQSISYIPVYEIRSAAVLEVNSIKPFEDIPYAPFRPVAQTLPISATAKATLDNYIEFINESTRIINNLIRVLETYNSDAVGYKDLKSYKGRGGLTYRYEDYKVPVSLYQAAVNGSSPTSPAWRKSINEQSHVLLNILTEMDQLSAALQEDATEKNYEKDNLTKAFGILERYSLLFQLWDDRKEKLYSDVRAVAESYPMASPTGSWAKSNKAILKLLDEDRVQLAKARALFKGDSTVHPSTIVIDQQIREILTNEFANMKGIEQLGRSNGNDPYTPYEEVAETSRSFSQKLQSKKETDREQYMGPFHPYVSFYNDVATYYNKFCELASIRILKTVQQTEVFKVEYPEKNVKEEETFPELPSPTFPIVKEDPKVRRTEEPDDQSQSDKPTGRVIHDTIKVTDIIRIETRQKDTVYIEKHDTIYRDSQGGRLLSLEGYATNNLVFLLDVSGSMNTGQKLPLLKKSMLLLLKILREEDHVSIVVYSGKAKIVLPPTSAKEQEKIKKVIENLRSDGDTDGNAGIKLAYKTADGNYVRAGNNRIVLATDGEFKISDETMALVAKFASQDVFLSVFNFGQSAAAAASLQKLSLLGKGNYEIITRQNSDVKLIMEAKARKK